MRTKPRVPLLTQHCVDRVRLDMTARGFALVDTPPFFDDDLFYRLRRTRTVLSYHSWWQFPQLAWHGLLMTGMERARSVGVPCTLHRRPGPGPERTVVVCSFEPRSAQPQAEKDYREVAQAHRGRGTLV